MTNNSATTTQGAAANGNPAGGADAGDAKSYTQAQLDAMFGERAKSAGSAARAEMLKALGFEKEEDAKSAFANYKKIEDAQKSEHQKALDRVAALEKDRETEKSARTAAEQRAQKLELRQEIARGVKKLKAEFASDAAEDDANEKLLLAVKFEDGKLVGLDEALKTLQKERDYLFARPGTVVSRAVSIDATNRGRVDSSGVIVSDENEQDMKNRYGIR